MLYVFVQLLNFYFFENIIFSKNTTFLANYSEHEHKKALNSYSPDISIIIPCYQKGKYLPRAFISCIEDQYLKKYNIIIEIICIDDGSTDKTLQIFQKLKNKYDPYNMHTDNSTQDEINNTLPYNCHIRIFHFEHNHGALYSRIFGYKQAKADYVMSLDADDEFIPGIMEHLLKLTSNRKDIDIIQFRLVEIKEPKENQKNQIKEEKMYKYSVLTYGGYPFDILSSINLNNTLQKEKYHLIDVNQNDIDSIPEATYINSSVFKKNLLKISVMWNMPGLFVKKEIINKVTNTLDFINENIKINGYEDRLIAYVCYYFCHKFYFLDEVGYIYHLGIRSAIRKPSLHYIDGIITELYKFGKINISNYLHF